MDRLLDEAAGTVDEDQRAGLYQHAAEYFAESFYAPFGLAFARPTSPSRGCTARA